MSERLKTGYVPAFPLRIEKPKSTIPGVMESEHHHRLWNLREAYDSVVGTREEFARRKAEIDQRLADADLGPKGHAKALRALRDEFAAKLDAPRKVVENARRYGDQILRSLTARADEPADKPMSRAEYRQELARGRAIERFTRLSPSERLSAIRVASDKRDYEFLQMILDEPALLDARIAEAIKTDIARNSNPTAFEYHQDLHGRIEQGATEHDGLTGALPVLAFTIDSTVQWLDQQIGDAPDMAERLAQQAADKAASNGGGGA